MSKVKNFFFGIGQKINQTYITWNRQPFEVTAEWFESMYQKNFTPDIKVKHDNKLYVEQGLAKPLLEHIMLSPDRRQHVIDAYKKLQQAFAFYGRNYEHIQNVCQAHKIKLNKDSSLHKYLEQIDDSIHRLTPLLDKHEKILSTGTIEEINGIEEIIDAKINEVFEFKSSRIEDYDYWDSVPDDVDFQDFFEHIRKVIYYVKEVNSLIPSIKETQYLITGDAGIGKSNLSVRMLIELRVKDQPILLLQAKSFSGESTYFEEVFFRILDIPSGYTLKEFLEKVNSYGKKKSKRVTIVIDGLNETTFTNAGFNSIWQLHLGNLFHQLSNYPWIIIICTLRRSYVERIWTNDTPGKLLVLEGFQDEITKKAVGKYFAHYKIDYPDSYSERDLFLFRTPLLLNLYCQMLNPLRKVTVKAKLGFDGYSTVFDKYIDDLSTKMKTEMQLGSQDQVKSAFDRCSDAFLDNLESSMKLLSYYEAIENRQLEADFSMNNSIAYRILEEYLIYIRDSVTSIESELVFHTYQEVGGYLLAKRLLTKYSSIQGVMESDFFQDYIIGDKDGGHQLRDDILQFLTVLSVDYVPYLSQYLQNDRVKKFVLLKLQREPKAEWNSALRTELVQSFTDNKDYQLLLDASTGLLTEPESPLRIIRLSETIFKLEALDLDMVWTQYVYHNASILTQETKKFLIEIENYNGQTELDDSKELKFELALLLLETTVRELRDLATKTLIEFGIYFPEKLFENLFKYSATSKVYIYERLASICYGICLRMQNDSDFVRTILSSNAKRIYDLQFAENPQHSTYNYHVIDSFKHLIDLAILKGVFELSDEQQRKLREYKFTSPEAWNNASEDDIETVREIAADSYRAVGPDPLRMDFVIYTISRLLKSNREEKWQNKLIAVANIYRRIFDLGYETLEFEDRDGQENQFFYGARKPIIEGKIDRLGKKYSWMAYFDYAGYLLNQGELDVWYPEDAGSEGEYQRLSDVHVEVSNTHPTEEQTRLYDYHMFRERGKKKDWASRTLYHTTEGIWTQKFDNQEFTLINGKVEEKVGESYDTRTYMMVEAYLVKKEDIEGQEHLIVGREFDWNDDIRFNITQSKTYFGELYWADNVSDIDSYIEHLPLEETEEVEVRLAIHDVIADEKYKDKQPGEIVIEQRNKQLQIEVEPSTIEYLWESESTVFPTLSRDIPSPNIGRQLSLRADTEGFTFLDDQNQVATKYFDFDDGIIDQDFTYLRTDLLNKYLQEKGLVLMYQIKQHSYDNVRDPEKGSNFRGMQFFFPNLKQEE